MQPFDILPIELMTDVFALAQPRPDLAAVCRLTTTLARTNQRDRQPWFHYIVFDSALPADADNGESRWVIPPYTRLPRFARFLKSRLPSDLAPRRECVASIDTNDAQTVVVSRELLDYLYSNRGPFVRQAALLLDSKEDPDHFQAMLQSQLGSYASPSKSSSSIPTTISYTWHLFPDAFQLCLYSLSANRLDLFADALSRLVHLLPMLASAASTLRSMLWLQLALDNRPSVRQALKSMSLTAVAAAAAGAGGPASVADASSASSTCMSFPQFIMLQALTEWNPRALAISRDVFRIHVPDYVAWLATQRSLMQRVSDSLRGGRDVGPTLAWLHDQGMPRGAFGTYLCATAASLDVFRTAFLEHDIHHAQTLPPGVLRRGLGSHLARWCTQLGTVDPELTQVALDHGLVSELVARRLVHVCTKEHNDVVRESILSRFPGCISPPRR